MYRCEVCDKIVGPNKSQLKIITKTRDKQYTNVVEKFDKKTRKKIRIPKRSNGWEIREEKAVCEECKRLFEKDGGNVEM